MREISQFLFWAFVVFLCFAVVPAVTICMIVAPIVYFYKGWCDDSATKEQRFNDRGMFFFRDYRGYNNL